MRGLHVVFDAAIAGPSWPGPLESGLPAVVGRAWLGERGLLDLLETELGLGGLWPSEAERAAALVPELAGRAGTSEGALWRESFAMDPLATAARLLRDRDALAMEGWRGQGGGPRLQGLWRATSAARPGAVERLRAVLEALPHQSVAIERLELFEDPAQLPRLWRDVLAALGARGVEVSVRPLPAAHAPADVSGARGDHFAPAGDGSLQLYRPYGPFEAARGVAAALATLDSLDGVVVVGGDATLDAALREQGLPTVGAASGPTGPGQLVRLVVEAAFFPMEPGDLHALLVCDPGPVRRSLARSLVRAVGTFASRRSRGWAKALQRHRDRLAQHAAASNSDSADNSDSAGNGDSASDSQSASDIAAREAALARAERLLTPAVGRDQPLPHAELDARLSLLAEWARSRAFDQPILNAVAAQAAELSELLRCRASASDADAATSHAELRRLCDRLTPVRTALPAQAGLAAVAHPGAVLGPARTIVWWNFTRAAARTPRPLRLSVAERAALRDVGVNAPDPGQAMEREAARWRRPLEQAAARLVLVCPRTDAAGNPASPHPLWDELHAAMGSGADVGLPLVERDSLVFDTAPAVHTPPPRRRPRPAPTATTIHSLELREHESPSSLETLLGCSLRWALHYGGDLRDGLATGPAVPSPLLLGSAAHELLAELLGDMTPAERANTDTVRARAEALVETRLPEVSEFLLLPRFSSEASQLRTSVVEAAAAIAELIDKLGAEVRGTELPGAGTVAGIDIAGTADLVLQNPDVVIDFKWGVSTYRDKLKAGTALQLAAYAALFRDGARLPAIAYYSLARHKLLAEPGAPLPGADEPGRASAIDMLNGAERSLAERLAALRRGELAVPGSDASDAKTSKKPDPGALTDDGMRLPAGCTYCGFAALCGRDAAS